MIHVEASELLVALELQEARVRAESSGSLLERIRRMRTADGADERAYWRKVGAREERRAR
jgi:hypothetical protein